MKPYQVNLFIDKEKPSFFLPSEPVFIYNNKKYLNFTLFDCFNRRNNEYLNEAARLNIDKHNIVDLKNPDDYMYALKNTMVEFKKLDSVIIFSDEIAGLYALFSIFSSKTTFLIDYETSPNIFVVLQYRNIEFYNHRDIEHLSKLMATHTDKVIVIDGLYEWLGCSGAVNEMIKIAKENQAVIIANELNSFGLLGRDGRGFVDLFNLYEDINIEIGSFNRYIGGYGAYIGAKKYLINKITENVNDIHMPVPQFMLAVNLAGIGLLRDEAKNRQVFSKLWTHSRFFINRLKQIGLKTMSETPVVVMILNNNQEADAFSKRLFDDGIITNTNKERVRMVLSIEHSRSDLDYTLDRIEAHFRDMGIVYPS